MLHNKLYLLHCNTSSEMSTVRTGVRPTPTIQKNFVRPFSKCGSLNDVPLRSLSSEPITKLELPSEVKQSKVMENGALLLFYEEGTAEELVEKHFKKSLRKLLRKEKKMKFGKIYKDFFPGWYFWILCVQFVGVDAPSPTAPPLECARGGGRGGVAPFRSSLKTLNSMSDMLALFLWLGVRPIGFSLTWYSMDPFFIPEWDRIGHARKSDPFESVLDLFPRGNSLLGILYILS